MVSHIRDRCQWPNTLSDNPYPVQIVYPWMTDQSSKASHFPSAGMVAGDETEIGRKDFGGFELGEAANFTYEGKPTDSVVC